MGVIYYIYHIESGKGYVGKHNKDDIYTRFNAHCKSKKTIPLANALRKYGKEAFKVVKLDSGQEDQDLYEKEMCWIDYLDTMAPNGYNLTYGGGWSGWKPAEETRKAIGYAKLGNTNTRKVTKEQVQAIRNSPNKSSWEWAVELGVSHQAIYLIRVRRTFKMEK